MVARVVTPIRVRAQRTYVFVHRFTQAYDANNWLVLVVVLHVFEALAYQHLSMEQIYQHIYVNVLMDLLVKIVRYRLINVD
jgi:hypothetical protein